MKGRAAGGRQIGKMRTLTAMGVVTGVLKPRCSTDWPANTQKDVADS